MVECSHENAFVRALGFASSRWFGNRDLHGVTELAWALHQLVLEAVGFGRTIVVGPFLVVRSRGGQQAMDHAQHPVPDRHTGALASAPAGDAVVGPLQRRALGP